MQASSGLEMSYSNLNATLRSVKPSINISNQALAKYFYKQGSVDLMRSVYGKIFLYQKEKLLRDMACANSTVLDTFNRVLIEDSTTCILNEKLETQYKGSGGSASSSSLKIDVIHELKTSTLLKIAILQGNKPDASSSNFILEEAQAGDLVLRDLGYSKLEVLAQLTARNVYFISRFPPSVNVYLNKEDSTPVELGRHLQHKHRGQKTIDLTVYLGRTKEKFRLIAYRIPAEASNERRRKAKRTAVCQRRTASEAYLNLLDFVILITNVPQEMIEAGVIGTIYRLRWGIELIFKTWKSQLKLQVNLTGYRATRIECYVYTILILALLTMVIWGWLKRVGLDVVGQEISLERLSKWLVNRKGYSWLLWGSVLRLEKELQSDLRVLKKQKRNRRTTLERVALCESYSEKFMVANF
jgi:hypothetical protein